VVVSVLERLQGLFQVLDGAVGRELPAPTFFEEVTGVPTEKKVSGAIRGGISQEITSTLMNPYLIMLALPFAGAMTAGKAGVPLGAQIFTNLTATGLEPGGAQLLMRGATAGFRLSARPATRLLAKGQLKGLTEEKFARVVAGYTGREMPPMTGDPLTNFVRFIQSSRDNPDWYEVGVRLGKAARGETDLTAPLVDVPPANVRRVLKDIAQGNESTPDLLPARRLVDDELARVGRSADEVLDAGDWQTLGREADTEAVAAAVGRTPRVAEDPLGKLTQADEVVDEAERVAARVELEQVGGPGSERVIPATDPVIPNPNTVTRDVRYLMSVWRDASRTGDSMGALIDDVANAILRDLKITEAGTIPAEIVCQLIFFFVKHLNALIHPLNIRNVS